MDLPQSNMPCTVRRTLLGLAAALARAALAPRRAAAQTRPLRRQPPH